jgi:hypothetical protein
MNDIIKRYEEIAGYELKKFGTYSKDEPQQTVTNKSKSKDHGEVFTPMWLVDEMVKESVDNITVPQNKVWMDMCTGYGAFTMRILNYLNDYYYSFNAKKYLKENIMMNEWQISSAIKLIYIFGTDINLYIGDSLALKSDMNPGIWVEVDGTWLKLGVKGIIKHYNALIKDFDKAAPIMEKSIKRFIKRKKLLNINNKK